MVAAQSLIFGPVVEYLAIRIVTRQAVFRTQQEAFVFIREDGVYVVGDKGAIVLMEMFE